MLNMIMALEIAEKALASLGAFSTILWAIGMVWYGMVLGDMSAFP